MQIRATDVEALPLDARQNERADELPCEADGRHSDHRPAEHRRRGLEATVGLHGDEKRHAKQRQPVELRRKDFHPAVAKAPLRTRRTRGKPLREERQAHGGDV
jgi:hypothetical protein